jgi:general secretion pathway protein C
MNWPQPGRLVGLYALLVLLSVGYALARLTWHVAGYSGIAAEPAADRAGRVGAGQAPDLAPIGRSAPFGRLDASAAPPTRLPLELRGAVMAEPAEASSAWIAQSGGAVRSFGIGDVVTAGAKLNSVAIDHVLLDVDGKLERLSFPKREGGAPTPAPLPARIPETGDEDRD